MPLVTSIEKLSDQERVKLSPIKSSTHWHPGTRKPSLIVNTIRKHIGNTG